MKYSQGSGNFQWLIALLAEQLQHLDDNGNYHRAL
jgi:hypothetical protein